MRRLLVDADLQLSVDGHPVAVRGDGDRVRIDIDRPRTAWRLLRSHRPGADLVRALTETLSGLGVDVDVRVGGRLAGRLGPSARPGALSRLLAVPGVEVRAPRMPAAVLIPATVLVGVSAGLLAALWLRRRH